MLSGIEARPRQTNKETDHADPPRLRLNPVLVCILAATAACVDEVAPPTEPGSTAVDAAARDLQDVEADFLGNVYDGSGLSSDTDLYLHLIPRDSATIAHLSGTNFSQTQWIDPSAGFSIEYFNPESGENVCGNSYVNFLSGNLSGTADEVHPSGPGSGTPPGFERHCIIPGQYEVRLVRGAVEGEVLKSFFVDYIPGGTGGPAAPIATASDGTDLWIEAPAFDPSTTLEWPDLVVNFHLNPSGSFSDTAVLDVENAGSNSNKSTFVNQGSPSGTVTDWFRFRTDRSSGSWNLGSRGQMLMRVWWNGNDPFDASGFFDHAERPVLRVRQYEDLVTPPATVAAGLEVKRPDEDPASAPAVTRNISIVVDTDPTACFDTESNSTWRNVDQFFDASCSEGTSLEYAWDVGPGFGPFTNDPVLEFFGHPTGGTKQIRLRVRDVAHSPATSDITQQTISVAPSLLSMTGPAFVTDKQLKTYTASTTSDWYERFDPETQTTWFFMIGGSTTYNRIWPAGEYTRGLRAEKVSPSPLGRGRIDVEVCHESIPGCDPPVMEFVASGPSLASVTDSPENRDLFGLGPWIHSGDDVTRFYDLTGLHEPGSPFADIGWLEEAAGSAWDAGGRFTVEWTQAHTDVEGVRAVDFTVTPSGALPYRFGMAIDPDLGVSPADDRSGYDADRRMAYVWDEGGALGFLLRGDGLRTLRGVDQYGARRFAPRAASDALAAGRSDGVRLLDGEDDVQFVLSADETSGASKWRLVILRASSVRELVAQADAYLGR